jgi:G3E family GTPase
MESKKVKVNLVTGALGAGKTTIILDLINQLSNQPKKEKVMWLKNEYGDVNIDSRLADQSIVQTKEILNGCLCCVLIGKLGTALKEIVENYNIDRLIIETAGTAHPFPVIDAIKKVENLELDSVIKVVDCLNFDKFDDKSYVARQQSKLFDLIVLNKVEKVSVDEMNRVEDEVYDLYLEIPKYKSEKGHVPVNLLTGYNSHPGKHSLSEIHEHIDDLEAFAFITAEFIDIDKLKIILENLNPDNFFRIKGLIKNKNKNYLLDYVLGQIEISEVNTEINDTTINFIGEKIKTFEREVLSSLQKIIL